MTGPPVLPIVGRAMAHGDRPALVDRKGRHTYADLLRASAAAAGTIREVAGARDLEEARVAFMTPPGRGYAAVQWGIWRAGGITVPLCAFHPPPELAYVLDDAGATLVVAHPSHEEVLRPLAEERGATLVTTEEVLGLGGAGPEGAGPGGAEREPAGARLPADAGIDETRGCLILYTSGTTGRPKGVLHTHRSLRAQIESLVQAWAWRPEDRILHVLPLHHTHGIVNAFLCALWAGAGCEMLPSFDSEAVWERFAAGAAGERPRVTLFMAVPTIYVKLIGAWEEAPEATRRAWSAGARSLRVMVSGSAALPVATFRRWREIAGHDLLERYGMTEIGMALSNPLDGERRPGTVGRPLPGVGVRLVDEEGRTLAEAEGPGVRGPNGRSVPPDAGPGEIEVRGPSVFREYWGRPRATREAFRDGWFRTGDVAAVEDGYWRILGRSSVDIIKTGGYKVSALEIEEALRAHPAVRDCAVVGLPDPEWGEVVCAAVVPSGPPGGSLDELLADWIRERLAPYKLPRRWAVVDALPRNAMGKVTKPDLRPIFGKGRDGERLGGG